MFDTIPTSESPEAETGVNPANALAAGDLGFEVTFFHVTSAIFGQNLDF